MEFKNSRFLVSDQWTNRDGHFFGEVSVMDNDRLVLKGTYTETGRGIPTIEAKNVTNYESGDWPYELRAQVISQSSPKK